MRDKLVEHFGVSLKNDNLQINRENYAIIDKRVYSKVPSSIIEIYKKEPERRKKTYENVDCTIYSDEWCASHKERCLLNYDYNMNYFEQLDKIDFNNCLNNMIEHFDKMEEIYDLNECKDVVGVYVLVLDNYKQIYIGQSHSSIKTRIMRHWSTKKEFDKLIFGKVDNSILSIDSFGALDTTRIFIYPTELCYEVEEKMVDFFEKKYLLNRTAGGIGGEHNYTNDKHSTLISVLANRKAHDLTNYIK